MHYFKDKQDQIISIEDKYWDRVQKLEPWIKETDKNGRELGTNLTSLKEKAPIEVPVTQLKGEITDQVIKKVTEPVKNVEVNNEPLKVEKLTPKRNAKGTRVKRKAKAPKA